MLGAEQVKLSAPALAHLMGQTEGWPAGVYLAGLSLSGRPDADELVRGRGMNERFITSYFAEEVLSQDSDQLREFILTMSILDRFCAPLCDAVGGTTGSAQVLDDLERRNQFLVPLDGEGRWFRFHHLFAAVARSELEARHGDRIAQLHERAAQWHRTNGDIAEAISHLRAAGRRGEAAELIQANWLTFVDAGRAPTVLVVAAVPREGTPTGVDPAEEVTAAWMAALFGDEAGLARHVQSLEGYADHGPLPDGARSVESAVSLIHGLFGYGGPVDDARGGDAGRGAGDGRSFAVLRHRPREPGSCGVRRRRAEPGDGDPRRAVLSEAAPAIIKVLGLSVQSLAEGELGRLDRSRELAERAIETVEARQLHVLPQAAWPSRHSGRSRRRWAR